MKKAILIFSILLSAVLVRYLYAIEEVETETKSLYEIEEFKRELEFDNRFVELAYDNKQIKNKNYDNIGKNLEEYNNINLIDGWVYSSLYTSQEKLNTLNGNRPTEEYIENYENADSLQKALELSIEDLHRPINSTCGTGLLGIIDEKSQKVFDLSYKLKRYEVSLDIILQYRDIISIKYDSNIEDVIKWKMNQYTNYQKDSIINIAYESIRFKTTEFDSNLYYTMYFDIFDHTIPSKGIPSHLIKINSNLTLADSNKILDLARKEFIDSWFYKTLNSKSKE